jgi:hypothetical protein
MLGNGKPYAATPGIKRVKIPLDGTVINLKQISRITFDANTDYGFYGSHGFQIDDISFTR